MSTNEIKESCQTFYSFQVKVKVRLKSEFNNIVGKVTGVDAKQFFLKTEADQEPVSVPYVSVANITHA